eukprot:TRINITY_DN3351_c0_g1_i1.p1 TRINITY_DN3351_c0_g1~~TRINITY_DN3351_c0_g1_i1.p1  ORF type:complete len:456 (+),score=68.74 TRINITY_DN3351_c0_g1_i1:67-1368(+)
MDRMMSYAWPLALLTSLFLIWGTGNSLNDFLTPQFTRAFTLQDWQGALVQFSGALGYFLGALPAATLVRSYGYKVTVITGLVVYSAGAFLFFPVTFIPGGSYWCFLICTYLIGFGNTFLETSANPWVLALGDKIRPGFGVQALNMAQIFNPVGSILAGLIGKYALYTENGAGVEVVRVPFLIIAGVLAAVMCLFCLTKFPQADSTNDETAGEKVEKSSPQSGFLATVARLLSNWIFVLAMAAQFFQLCAQTGIWGFTIRYVQANIPNLSDANAGNYVLATHSIFLVGRFVASGLLSLVSEEHLLGLYAVLASACSFLAAVLHGEVAAVCLVATTFFMSTMYATIFGTALAMLEPNDKEVGAGLLVMTILGIGIGPVVMGAVSTATGSINVACFVPAACYISVAAYAAVLALRSRAQRDIAVGKGEAQLHGAVP